MSEIPVPEYLPEGVSDETIEWLRSVDRALSAGWYSQVQKVRWRTLRTTPARMLPTIDSLAALFIRLPPPNLISELCLMGLVVREERWPCTVDGAAWDYAVREFDFYLSLDFRRFLDLPRRPARPSFDALGMDTARLWSTRSTDTKHKVGACLMSDTSHTVVGIGFNGRYPGAASEERVSSEIGGSEFIHAEVNALARARWEHGETHTLYCTHEPCHNCALAILASRQVRRVVFLKPYAGDGKVRRGREVLKDAGIEVTAWTF